MLMKDEQVGDLDLAAARGAVALGDRVAAHHPDGKIGGDDLPGRLRIDQLALEPGDLRRPEDRGSGAILADGAAVGAHVEHEHIEQRTIGDPAIDASGLG